MNITLEPGFKEVTGLPVVESSTGKELMALTQSGATREKIVAFEAAACKALTAAGVKFTYGNTDDVCPIKHHFAPGLYGREILLPAGVWIVGKIHKHAHLNTISKGHVTVVTEFASEELRGPVTFTSIAGSKRAVVAHEDTIWTTYHPHPNPMATIEEIENWVIAKTFAEYDSFAVGHSKVKELV
jgi:hypothetical protein